MRQIITHFTDNDLYTFSCQYYIMQKYPRAEVEYTFIDRNKTCYPKGFDKLLQEQIDYMAGVTITDQEIDFMTEKLVWLPQHPHSRQMVQHHHVGDAYPFEHLRTASHPERRRR